MSLAFCIIIEPSFRYCSDQHGHHDAKDTSDTYNTYGSILTVLQTAYNKVLILTKKTQHKKKRIGPRMQRSSTQQGNQLMNVLRGIT